MSLLLRLFRFPAIAVGVLSPSPARLSLASLYSMALALVGVPAVARCLLRWVALASLTETSALYLARLTSLSGRLSVRRAPAAALHCSIKTFIEPMITNLLDGMPWPPTETRELLSDSLTGCQVQEGPPFPMPGGRMPPKKPPV
jgi:hypothetical protein